MNHVADKIFDLAIWPWCVKQGKPNTSDSCPIALALEEAGYGEIEVQRKNLTFSDGAARYRAKLSEKAQRFIDDFDESRRVEPTILTIRAHLQ